MNSSDKDMGRKEQDDLRQRLEQAEKRTKVLEQQMADLTRRLDEMEAVFATLGG